MTVAELKSLAPLSDIYELKPEMKYLICIQPGVMSGQTIEAMLTGLAKMGLHVALISVRDQVPVIYCMEANDAS